MKKANSSNSHTLILKILEEARWCPSPDNIQPWQFKLLTETSFEIHCTDQSDWMVYDINGHVTWLTIGFLFETLNITALEFGYEIQYTKLNENTNQTIIFNAQLLTTTQGKSTLFSSIKSRSVQRKPMGSKPLTQTEKNELLACIPKEFSLQLFEAFTEKLQIGKLLYGNSTTRYMMKEGYHVHSKVIDWQQGNEYFSETKIPPKSLGVDPITTALTKWALADWSRFHFIERYLAGTVWAKFLMDFCTSITCSGHFLLTYKKPIETLDEFIESGKVIMRLWLTFEHLGLGFQPEYTPIMFAEMVRNNIDFSQDIRTMNNVKMMNNQLEAFLGEKNTLNSAYLARYGRSTSVKSRSIRKPLVELLIK